MNEATAFTLKEWESFYVIVGSTAGALTGLQFVVLTLIAESGAVRGRGETISAFGSPNVVHFCAALLVSAIFSAPWPSLGPPGVAVALCGALGLTYSIAVLRRARRQRDYKPVMEDWLWHAAFPILAYTALLYAGVTLARIASASYVVGAVALSLVFIGIHNAWDTVTYITLEQARRHDAVATPAAPPRVPTTTEAGRAVEPSGPAAPPA